MLALDASLTGLVGHYGNQCYALPLPKNFHNYTIVHLEILNKVVALKIWTSQWHNSKMYIKCYNMVVVVVMVSERTRDEILGTCARNIWTLAALYNINIHVEHIARPNFIANLLSRYTFDKHSRDKLTYLPDTVWIHTHIDLTCLNCEI